MKIRLIHLNSSIGSIIPSYNILSIYSFTFSLYLGFNLYALHLTGFTYGINGIFISLDSLSMIFSSKNLFIIESREDYVESVYYWLSWILDVWKGLPLQLVVDISLEAYSWRPFSFFLSTFSIFSSSSPSASPLISRATLALLLFPFL